MINTLLTHVPIKMENKEVEVNDNGEEHIRDDNDINSEGDAEEEDDEDDLEEDLDEDDDEDDDEEVDDLASDVLEVEQEVTMLMSSDEEAELEAQRIRFPEKRASRKKSHDSKSSRSTSRNSNTSQTSNATNVSNHTTTNNNSIPANSTKTNKKDLTTDNNNKREKDQQHTKNANIAPEKTSETESTTTTTINYDDDMQLIVKELGLSKDNHTNSGQSSGSANVENKTYKRKIRNLEATTSVPSNKIKFLQHTESLTTLPTPAENNIRIVSSSSIPSYTVLDSNGYISLDLNEDNKPSTCKNIIKEVEANVDREESIVELNPEKLIDAENVSSFIFKGEEYVQMSKDYYIKEKLELVKQLEKLKNTVAGIKKLLKDT
uniref:Uncharacterized protein n=1 Tax=Musca domestica TaxID=7370 RepID=A0A1I8MCW7_MUSDO